ncbi:hypothetical protein LINPERHAP2_LOCUS3181 [Linum perenne]
MLRSSSSSRISSIALQRSYRVLTSILTRRLAELGASLGFKYGRRG